jgi:hypothetical protein
MASDRGADQRAQGSAGGQGRGDRLGRRAGEAGADVSPFDGSVPRRETAVVSARQARVGTSSGPQRFKTWPDLWRAVRVYCRDYVETRLATLNPNVQRGDDFYLSLRKWDRKKHVALKVRLDLGPVNAARNAASKLRTGIEAAIAFSESEVRKVGYQPAPLVRELAETCRPMLARLRKELTHQLEIERRALLILEFDRPRQWWWRDQPTARDLAVLSLLSGSRPQLKGGPSNHHVEAVVVAEQNALNHWRRRYRSNLQRRARAAVTT